MNAETTAYTGRKEEIKGRESHAPGFLPLLILPFLTLQLAFRLPAWVFMWVMAFALFGYLAVVYAWAAWKGGAP